MSVYFFSINARGLSNLLKLKSLFLYCKGKGTDFYFVQERLSVTYVTMFPRGGMRHCIP